MSHPEPTPPVLAKQLPPLAEPTEFDRDRDAVNRLADARQRIGAELSKVIVGQREVIDEMLIAMLSGGHCLITGAPGLAKTLLVKSLADLFHLSFHRIQFTPDLMPSDITGTEMIRETAEGREMVFQKGPIFANMILADEINRTPPKTQSALLEAMQEHQVTAAGITFPLAEPFFVLATQNPIEMEGTYPLPEAQLDRFMFNVVIDYLPEDDEVEVVTRTTGAKSGKIEPLFAAEELMACQEVVRKVPVAEEVVRYAVRLVAASRPGQEGSGEFVNNYVNWGAGLRAAQYLILGGKTRALLEGRTHVAPEDVRALAPAVLRHRVLPNYRAEAEGIGVKEIIRHLIETVPATL